MTADRERLVWLAAMIVDEAAEQAEKERVPPTLGLRLALGFLCSIADGPIFARSSHRSVFDEFWKVVTGPDASGSPEMQRYGRHTHASGCLQQIARQLGQAELFFNGVRESRHRQFLADAVRAAGRAPRGKHGCGSNLKRPMDGREDR